MGKSEVLVLGEENEEKLSAAFLVKLTLRHFALPFAFETGF